MKHWKDVTYKEFKKIQEITENTELTENEQLMELVLALYGDIPLSELSIYTQYIYDLMREPLPDGDKIDKTVEVNGRKYEVVRDIEKIITSQFLDYTSYVKNKADMPSILSCFFIPAGHTYNDGYDMEEVKNDIADMPIGTVQSYCFFFRKKCLKSERTFLLSLMVETLSLKGMSWKNRMRMALAQATLWANMVSLTSSSRSSKNRV